MRIAATEEATDHQETAVPEPLTTVKVIRNLKNMRRGPFTFHP